MKFAQRDCPKFAVKPGGGCRETPKFCGRHIMEAHLGTVLGPSKNLVCPTRAAGRAPNGPHLADCHASERPNLISALFLPKTLAEWFGHSVIMQFWPNFSAFWLNISAKIAILPYFCFCRNWKSPFCHTLLLTAVSSVVLLQMKV